MILLQVQQKECASVLIDDITNDCKDLHLPIGQRDILPFSTSDIDGNYCSWGFPNSNGGGGTV